MPLAATHIRFALDLKETYQATDLQKYLCGTVYPDSRYITKVNRVLTHPEDFEQWNIAELSDFQKGWHAHLLCDKLQRILSEEILPLVPEIENTQDNDIWIKRTAIKILLDIADANSIDIRAYTSFLIDRENPNSENPEQIIEYYQIFQNMYADPEHLTVDACHQMWHALGVPEEITLKVRNQSLAYEADSEMMKKIGEMYERMIEMTTVDGRQTTGYRQ